MKMPAILTALSLIAGCLGSVTPGFAFDNSFRITELYSNLDGSIQYVQLRETGGVNGLNHLAGLKLRSTHDGVTKEFVFPADLPNDTTANEWLLIATTECVPFYGFPVEAVGEWNCVAPDFRIPERFLPTDAGTIDFIGVDRMSYTSLPTDGVHGLGQDGSVVQASVRPFQTPEIVVAWIASDSRSFTLPTPVIVTPTSVAAVEFYDQALDHYFISASAPDLEAIATGRFGGWVPTGQTLTVWAGTIGVTLSYSPEYVGVSPFDAPVCRFYIPPSQGDSHFFAASPEECAAVKARFPGFTLETPAAFYVRRVSLSGDCPYNSTFGFSTPVYRLWNGRADTNHRYVTDIAVRDQMVALGWIKEGEGSDAIVFCAYE